MEIVKKNIKINRKRDYPQICFIGDTHIGAKAFDENNFKDAIKYVLEKENRYIIGMGDMIDAISYKDPRFNVREIDTATMYIDEQIRKLQDYLIEVKDRIIGLHIGNHGGLFCQRTATMGIETMCKNMNIPFLDDTALEVIKIMNNKGKTVRKWKIHTSHGYGGGWTLGAVVNRILKEPQIIRDATVHAMGHSHKLFCFPYPLGMNEEGDKLIPKYAWFVNTGSFLKGYLIGASTYSERKHYSPNPMGFGVAVLMEDGVVCYPKLMDKNVRW